MIDERDCCGTFKGTPHRKTCSKFKGYTQADIEAAIEAERERFKKIAADTLGWVSATDRDKAFNDPDFVGEVVRIRLTGLTELAELVRPGCREAARKKFTEETAAAIRSMK